MSKSLLNDDLWTQFYLKLSEESSNVAADKFLSRSRVSQKVKKAVFYNFYNVRCKSFRYKISNRKLCSYEIFFKLLYDDDRILSRTNLDNILLYLICMSQGVRYSVHGDRDVNWHGGGHQTDEP